MSLRAGLICHLLPCPSLLRFQATALQFVYGIKLTLAPQHSLLPMAPALSFPHPRMPPGHEGPAKEGARGGPLSPPYPTPKWFPLDLCVIFIFFALVYTKQKQKTNNQKHKAIIIKLSAGTPCHPPTPTCKGRWGSPKQEGEEKAPHRTPEGSARALLGVSWGSGVGGGGGDVPRAPPGRGSQFSILERGGCPLE